MPFSKLLDEAVSSSHKKIALLKQQTESAKKQHEFAAKCKDKILKNSGSSTATEIGRIEEAESVVAKASEVLESYLSDVIQKEAGAIQFFEQAFRVLEIIQGLNQAVMPKEAMYPSLFSVKGRSTTSSPSSSFSLPSDRQFSDFTIGVNKNSQLYLNLSYWKKVPALKPHAEMIQDAFTRIVGSDFLVVEKEVNGWMNAFSGFLEEVTCASSVAEVQTQIISARLSSILSRVGHVDVSRVAETTAELEFWAQSHSTESRKAKALKVVKNWFDEIAEHLRKNGYVS